MIKKSIAKVSVRLGFIALAMAAIFAGEPAAKAQSTIFNIPTTDTLTPKKGYLEFDYLIQTPATEGVDRVKIYAPRVIVGVAPGLEVGANFFNFDLPGPEATFSYFQPNVKYRFYNNDDSGWAAAAGVIAYLPINHREGADSYGLVYGNISKKVKTGNYGPRLTVGPYGIVGADEGYYGTKAGAIVGYEQPITSKVSIVADWFSGVSGFGYFTPGVSILMPKNGLLNIGYVIGNDSYSEPKNNNRYFFAYYGITFP